MVDIELNEHCKGTRFKSKILDIKYYDKDISDILSYSICDWIFQWA